MIMSDSGVGIFFERPVALGFIVFGFLVMAGRAVSVARQRKGQTAATSDVE